MRVENVKGAVWTVDEIEFYKRRPQRCTGGGGGGSGSSSGAGSTGGNGSNSNQNVGAHSNSLNSIGLNVTSPTSLLAPNFPRAFEANSNYGKVPISAATAAAAAAAAFQSNSHKAANVTVLSSAMAAAAALHLKAGSGYQRCEYSLVLFSFCFVVCFLVCYKFFHLLKFPIYNSLYSQQISFTILWKNKTKRIPILHPETSI